MQGEHKSSSVQKLTTQPVEEVLEPDSSLWCPSESVCTSTSSPMPTCNLPSHLGGGGPEERTASIPAPAPWHGSTWRTWLGSWCHCSEGAEERQHRLASPSSEDEHSHQVAKNTFFFFFYRNNYKKKLVYLEHL